MKILLIGPHRGGKTTLGGHVSTQLGLAFTDIDSAIAAEHGDVLNLWNRIGARQFSELCRAKISSIQVAPDAPPHLVALGAGVFFDEAGDTSWVNSFPRAALTGDPAILFQRTSGFRSLEDYRRRQFSPTQQQVYDAAEIVIDTGRQCEADAARQLADWVNEMR